MPTRNINELNVRPVLAGLLIAVSLAGLASVFAIGWHVLFPEPRFEARMDSNCSLNIGPCSARFGDASEITMTIAPSRAVAKEPLRFTVQVSGHTAEKVAVTLSGKRMDMGVVSAPLLDIGHGLFAGDAVLPVSVGDHMTWSATVTSVASSGAFRAHFEFDVFSR